MLVNLAYLHWVIKKIPVPEEEKGAEKQSNIVIHVPNIKLFEMFRFNNIPARVDSAGTTTSD